MNSRNRKVAITAFVLVLGVALFVGTRESEVNSHRRALHRVEVERFPFATNWSVGERLVASFHRRKDEELDRQEQFHRSNLVRLGYFQVIDLTVPTNEYGIFTAAANSNKWPATCGAFHIRHRE